MPASTTGADLDLLRPFTAVLRRRGLTDCDPALERRFMGLPGLIRLSALHAMPNDQNKRNDAHNYK
jgi:hypothetical protein